MQTLKKILILLILPTNLFLGGCESASDVLASAENLRSEVVAKYQEIRDGVANAVTEAQNAYESLLEKKQQLEDLIAQVNEAVDAINTLMGKDKESENAATLEDLAAQKAELEAMMQNLQSELENTNEDIEEEEINQIVENS